RQPLAADDFVKGSECFFRSTPGRNVVTGSEKMCGVDANTEPLRLAHVLKNKRKLLKRMPEASSLTGGDLQRDARFGFRQLAMNLVEIRDDFFQARLHTRAHVR